MLKSIYELPPEDELRHRTRPYVNHAVQFKPRFSRQERCRMLEAVGLNIFAFPSAMVTGCDLLSDSGTTAMTNEQWALLHRGDEAYGANQGWFALADQVRATFGEAFWHDRAAREPHAFLYHQGRSAEYALFSQLAREREGQVIPSNGHFDTTRANVEHSGMQAVDLFSPALAAGDADDRFKGNMDVGRLAALLDERAGDVPLILISVTNNTGGGQPVSMANIRAVAALARDHGVPVLLDACRFAENAWFIRAHEPGYAGAAIADIVREMFSHVDGFLISFKKDGLANMGGGLFLRGDGAMVRRYPDLRARLTDDQLAREGNPTYGGMSGRDIMALVGGLRQVTDPGYLTHRVEQVRGLGERMAAAGIPIATPIGGHAVYLRVNDFFADTDLPPSGYGGAALSVSLLAAYGHRTGEVGYLNFGKYDPRTDTEAFPAVNYLRFAVPRLRYEQQDLDAVAEAVGVLHGCRDRIPPVDIEYGRELPLRYFKCRLAFRDPAWMAALGG